VSAIFGFFLRTKFGANYVSTSGVTPEYQENTTDPCRQSLTNLITYIYNVVTRYVGLDIKV
jgi:hypothetical protein